MKEQGFSTLTLEELKTREKYLKVSVAMFIVAIVLLIAAGIFISIKKSFSVLSITPIAFIPLLILNSANLKKVQAEIALRNRENRLRRSGNLADYNFSNVNESKLIH